MASERFVVRVSKDYLVFCSGHFISYESDKCECLHGHNYRAAVAVEAPLDNNHYVFDFIALKKIARSLTDELDHKMMLPQGNDLIRVSTGERQVTVNFKDREWQFPKEDCLMLPIANTTAELLARYLGQRILKELETRHNFHPSVLSVEVEESFGQAATYTWTK
jgi:6-pyruvoyltetrahydropterin/6-carboxytetrahydropterin synthase